MKNFRLFFGRNDMHFALRTEGVDGKDDGDIALDDLFMSHPQRVRGLKI